jgi:hypothetical protein
VIDEQTDDYRRDPHNNNQQTNRIINQNPNGDPPHSSTSKNSNLFLVVFVILPVIYLSATYLSARGYEVGSSFHILCKPNDPHCVSPFGNQTGSAFGVSTTQAASASRPISNQTALMLNWIMLPVTLSMVILYEIRIEKLTLIAKKFTGQQQPGQQHLGGPADLQ